jgi:hypothetical protein
MSEPTNQLFKQIWSGRSMLMNNRGNEPSRSFPRQCSIISIQRYYEIHVIIGRKTTICWKTRLSMTYKLTSTLALLIIAPEPWDQSSYSNHTVREDIRQRIKQHRTLSLATPLGCKLGIASDFSNVTSCGYRMGKYIQDFASSLLSFSEISLVTFVHD